ncbi:PEP-CTERM sorting domain-containing protein [Hydrogenophaga sp.]|uniref:PEP-CTERM sorting domain-containing protein n=1 Tax=Hydrogenophaga sp. TaxID=1904254 RepID=UPI0027300097|nr:PEP-CTERM sorting domain-containing protein [Hydrogenophaga sp.]MDP1685506.1 PEP-CTERM sorting domain-containing protein [Hydrogenophaga sp.]
MKTINILRSALLSGSCLFLGSVFASPVGYEFATDGFLHGNPTITSLFPADSKVFGTFNYDSKGSYLGNSGDLGYEPGFAVHSAPSEGGVSVYSMLSGTVAGFSFSDVRGSFNLNNRPEFGVLPDVVTMNADPSILVGMNSVPTGTSRQLIGFSVGDYTLINVRMFWSDWDGAYLNSTDLLDSPPLFLGTLAFDFIRTVDPTNTLDVPFYSNTVFFSNLRVNRVPEPATYLLIAVSLLVIGGLVRRRKDISSSTP